QQVSLPCSSPRRWQQSWFLGASRSQLFRRAHSTGKLATSGTTVRPVSRPGFSLSWLSDQRSEEHTSELQSRFDIVCRLLREKKKNRGRRSHQRREQAQIPAGGADAPDEAGEGPTAARREPARRRRPRRVCTPSRRPPHRNLN